MQEDFSASASQQLDSEVESTESSRCSSRRSSVSSRSSSTSSRSKQLHLVQGSKRRLVRGRSSGQSRNKTEKRYDAHVPVFSNLQFPTSIVLEPFPNRRMRSVCTAGGLLVTVHRNGLRAYRQRYLSPVEEGKDRPCGGYNRKVGPRDNECTKNGTDVRTGLWELVEHNEDFLLQDAYLCVSAEPVFARERVLPLKWHRYVAAACGSDRTRFSVCVLSTTAHFVLHHELHGKNKVVALNFALVAMHLLPGSRQFQPFVMSIDEVGEVVIFDVERNHAVKLTIPHTFAETGGTKTTATTTDVVEPTVDVTPSSGEGKSAETACTADDLFHTDGGKRSSTSPLGTSTSPTMLSLYRFDAGLASTLCLVGPCKVLCKHCNNSATGSRNCEDEANNSGRNVFGNPGSLVMNLFISSRTDSAEGQTELHVHHLRFMLKLSPLQAVVLDENPIVRECAPEDVCDVGAAMLHVPFHEDLPPRFLIGRPRLRLWSLSACTGKLLQLHHVYRDTDGSGKGARTLQEYFVRFLPLGRHVLIHDVSTSWLCSAALTDDDVILLLGQDPLPTNLDKSAATEDATMRALGVTKEEKSASDEREALEAWFDSVEDPVIEVPVPSERPQEKQQQQQQKSHQEELRRCVESSLPLGSPPLTFKDPSQDYTVLMVLATPGTFSSPPPKTEKTLPSIRQLLSLPHSNELIFFLGYTDAIYSIRLPFKWNIAPEVRSKRYVSPKRLGGMASRMPDSWMGAALAAGCSLNLGIARPLVSAMWSLRGEAVADKDFLPPVKPHLPKKEEKQESSPVVLIGDDEKVSSPVCAVVNLRTHASVATKTRRKKRRSAASSVIMTDDRFSDADDDLRMTYVVDEQKKLLQADYQHEAVRHGVEEICMRNTPWLTQLITVDEPLQRSTVLSEWSVGHDRLYVHFTQEGIEIMERGGKSLTITDGSTISREDWDKSLRDRFVLSDIKRGDHSAGFMQAFRHAQQKRKQLHDRGGTFDFKAYFSSCVVPQRLLDLQEDDRCRFELADLRVAFEEKMKAFHEVETVVVYENQELLEVSPGVSDDHDKGDFGRSSRQRRRWVPHSTFPYDDGKGNVVDISALNATAAPSSKATTLKNSATALNASPTVASMGWRWESNVPDESPLRSGRPKHVRKELQSWSVGVWMYAERWPNLKEELEGTFEWSATADADVVKVRRRMLSRRRINLAVEAAMKKCEEEYIKSEEQLRMELDL